MTEITQYVSNKVEDLQKNQGLALPKGYSVGNALQTAWLEITDDSHGQPLSQVCSPKSISKALTNMVIQGLSSAKNQCYFIPYGSQLTMQRSYFGTTSVVKRLSNVKDIKAQVVFEGDGFEIGSDDEFNEVVTKFEPKFENRDNEIVGAFAVVIKNDGTKDYTIMTKKEIETSWGQARSKRSGARANFKQEMAKRTVLNRAAKFYINSANDNEMLLQSINDTTADEYENDDPKDVTPKSQETVSNLLNDSDKKDEKAKDAKKDDSTDTTEPAKDVTPKPKEADEDNSHQEVKDAPKEGRKQTDEELFAELKANNGEKKEDDFDDNSHEEQVQLFDQINDTNTK